MSPLTLSLLRVILIDFTLSDARLINGAHFRVKRVNNITLDVGPIKKCRLSKLNVFITVRVYSFQVLISQDAAKMLPNVQVL